MAVYFLLNANTNWIIPNLVEQLLSSIPLSVGVVKYIDYTFLEG